MLDFAGAAEEPDDDAIEAQTDHGTAGEPDPPLQQVVQRRVDVNAALGVALIRRTAELGQVRYRGSG